MDSSQYNHLIYAAVRRAHIHYREIAAAFAAPAADPESALLGVQTAARKIYSQLQEAESAVLMQMISIDDQPLVPAAITQALAALAASYQLLAQASSWDGLLQAELAPLADIDRRLRDDVAQAWLRQAAAA